jgi:autotransporter-associated beta strand protein
MVDSTQPYSFTGPGGIDGATSLLVTNTGSLFLGTSNGYTGGTIVGGGTLTITDNSALGASAGPVALTGGNLQLGATLSSARSLAINANTIIGVAAGATAQWGGVISGNGQLSKTDTGTLTLTATNTSTGQVWVRAGDLSVDSNGSYTNNTWDDVGYGSGDNATMTLKGNGSFSTGGDFNIGDVDNAIGVLNIQDSAKLTANNLFVASANNAASTAQGTVNQTGGTVTQMSTAVGAFAIGGRRDTANDPGSVGIYNMINGTLIASSGILVCQSRTDRPFRIWLAIRSLLSEIDRMSFAR